MEDECNWQIDATGVNIHKGKIGENGEAVVDLIKVSKHSDNPKGMIMRGNITDSILTGSMAGKTIADLKTAMATGDWYINLDTARSSGWELSEDK